MAMFWAVACLVVLGDGTVVQTKWVRCIFFVALQVIFDIDRIIFCSAILLAGVVLPTPAAPATSTVINQQSILSTMCR
jgi:hypothetical protein